MLCHLSFWKFSNISVRIFKKLNDKALINDFFEISLRTLTEKIKNELVEVEVEIKNDSPWAFWTSKIWKVPSASMFLDKILKNDFWFFFWKFSKNSENNKFIEKSMKTQPAIAIPQHQKSFSIREIYLCMGFKQTEE